MIARLKSLFPVLVVLAAFLWSVVSILRSRHAETPPGTKIVLRIGHWQLEAGVRDALNQLAAEYHTLHPEVSIVQDPIPESTYGMWLTTQLMGGTAPDLLEPGMVFQPILIGYYDRYFVPLTRYVNEANPYNAGTALAGVPWRKTFKDGMRNSYVEELQDYMTVPLSQFGVRIFYNKNLLQRLTGLDQPPHDFRSFMAVCDQIRRQRNAQGQEYVPIACSSYHIGMWEGYLCDPLTYGAVRLGDFNRDGAFGEDEFYVAFQTGRISFDFPGYVARFQMLRELTREFQTGWTGLGRDEAVFLFAQQRAVFITTGTWDAGGLREQAAGDFEIGVMDFPYPTKTDPEFGRVVEGPVYERPQGGFPFGITRTCPHPEVAVDFLQFLTSQRVNEKLNRIIGWIPCIVGTQLDPNLKAFEPHLEGVFGAMPVTLGGDTFIKWGQLTSLFDIGELNYAGLATDYSAYYREHGGEEFQEMQRNRHRVMAGDEQFLAGFRARALAAHGPEAESLWIKYRGLAASRMIFRDLTASLLRKLLAAGPTTNAIAPYEISPHALDHVRAQLGKNPEGGN